MGDMKDKMEEMKGKVEQKTTDTADSMKTRMEQMREENASHSANEE